MIKYKPYLFYVNLRMPVTYWTKLLGVAGFKMLKLKSQISYLYLHTRGPVGAFYTRYHGNVKCKVIYYEIYGTVFYIIFLI